MKFCSECGANVAGKKFCSECGKSIIEETKSEDLKEPIPITPTSEKEADKQNLKGPFWQKTWFVIAMMIVCPPVGIILIWLSGEVKGSAKTVLTIFTCLYLFLIYPVMGAAVLNAGGSSKTITATAKQTTTAVKEPTEADFKAACVAQPYTDLARTPDSYKNMKIVITGKVVQVMEKSNGAQYRIAVDGNYDQMFYADYTGSFGQGRILEDDTVTLWGTYDGLMSYNSTIGGKITVPSLIAKYYLITQ